VSDATGAGRYAGGSGRSWGPVAVVAGFLAFGLSNLAVWGTLLTTIFFTVFAYEVARGTPWPRRRASMRAPLRRELSIVGFPKRDYVLKLSLAG
jgi:hypothetical protein